MQTKMFWVILIIILTYFNIVCSARSRTGNYAVSRGTTVTMNCIPPNVRHNKSIVTGKRFNQWMDGEGKDILNPRVDILKTGQLQILNTVEHDSGIYHCNYSSPDSMKHFGAPSKIFEHKLIVYGLSGHKFQTVVKFDITKYGSKKTKSLLRDLLKEKVCTRDRICTVGAVTTANCEIIDTEGEMCDIEMAYDAIETPTNAECDEACVRSGMIANLKKAQRLLQAVLAAQLDDPLSPLKPEMRVFDTKHIITCREGYHLVKSEYERCFPCLSGTHSEPGALECDQCPIGFYQEKFASRDCEQCQENKTTETAGSKSRDDCRPVTDMGILHDIKQGIASIFKG